MILTAEPGFSSTPERLYSHVPTIASIPSHRAQLPGRLGAHLSCESIYIRGQHSVLNVIDYGQDSEPHPSGDCSLQA